MTAIDPITLEVLRHKFEGIAEEMETTLLRSSFSPIVKEGMDASASLFTPEGVTLAQACAIPIHLGTLIPCLATMMETFPPAEMQPNAHAQQQFRHPESDQRRCRCQCQVDRPATRTCCHRSNARRVTRRDDGDCRTAR